MKKISKNTRKIRKNSSFWSLIHQCFWNLSLNLRCLSTIIWMLTMSLVGIKTMSITIRTNGLTWKTLLISSTWGKNLGFCSHRVLPRLWNINRYLMKWNLISYMKNLTLKLSKISSKKSPFNSLNILNIYSFIWG